MKTLYIQTLVLVGGLCALSACGTGHKEGDTDSADSLKVVQVQTAPALLKTIDVREELTTTLEAKVKNNISAQSGGRLVALAVQVGDRVVRGQIVARLEATQLATAQIQFDDAETNFRRVDEVYRAGGLSLAQWEQARSAMLVAQQQVKNLSANTELRSPISGVVTAKNYDNGDMTSPTLPIVVIEQISPVKGIVKVSESLYSQLRKGTRASLEVQALPDQTFDGQISNIYPTVDQQSHTITVEVEFANARQELRPGMFGRISLDLGQSEALLIPDKAVLRMVGAGTRYVYVKQGDKAEYRVVTLGRKEGDMQEITSGLKAGEVVVVQGQSSLTDGTLIKE